MSLTQQQAERYSRQIILKEFGVKAQEKLLASKVLVVGAGGLGCSAALYLAAAGVGTLGLVDADEVDLANLQRQVLHRTADLGKAKVDSAATTLRAINPEVLVRTYRLHLAAANIRQIIRDYDFVIDGTDTFGGKFLINDACFFERIAFSHASALGFTGQIMTVLPGESCCYRCLLAEPPASGLTPTCSQAGILGVLPGVIGVLQAAEAIKFLAKIGELLTNRILIYEALPGSFREVSLSRNPDCRLCGQNLTVTKLRDEVPDDCRGLGTAQKDNKSARSKAGHEG